MRSKYPGVKHGRCSPIYVPFRKTLVPNIAFPTFKRAISGISLSYIDCAMVPVGLPETVLLMIKQFRIIIDCHPVGYRGAGLIKAGFARVTRPGTVIVRSNTAGTASLSPSAICHVPFRLIVSRVISFFAHPASKIKQSDKTGNFLFIFIYATIEK